MLKIDEKIRIFEELLESQDYIYAEEMYIYFFTLEQGSFDFLEKLNSIEEIKNKVDFVLAKIAKHEHQDAISNIIENYMY
jgi:hypothetical protein|uniref:hypothetical protein n=1 Tax=Aliarcobacter sp. TaxID=2321116 RepID=UPI0040482D84